ncbi:MAG: LCP family protein [Ruminococcus sp.]|nr:LCP family protein [Ruminococcus sp.]
MSKHYAKKEKKPTNKKKIILPIIAAAVVVFGAVAGFLIYQFVFREPPHPEPEQIIADLNADESVSKLKIGGTYYDFNVTSPGINNDVVEDDVYKCDITIERTSEIYGIGPCLFSVNYVREGFEYKYRDATSNDEIKLIALKGVEVEKATKKATKAYKAAKFTEQKTDLEKGVDKLIFTVEDDEYEGSLTVAYKFDEFEGWKFYKINDKNVSFKKGVTHKEDGLYTNSNVKNILFLGIDSDSGVGRSDCMMLISVDSNTGKIKQTSFMRDNWFNIPGYGQNKLNAAYAFGGAELTKSTIEQTFGIKIDNYVATSFSTFKEVVNALGGVTVNISADEAGYINWQLGKNGQTGVGLVPYSGGNVRLNGQQALWLCRDRGGNGYSGNDFIRTARQRRVIQSIVSTYSNYTPSKILSVINTLKGSVKTDLTSKDFKWYAQRCTKFFGYKFAERCVPTDGEWQSGYSSGGAWIISLNNFPQLKSDIQTFIYEDLK